MPQNLFAQVEFKSYRLLSKRLQFRLPNNILTSGKPDDEVCHQGIQSRLPTSHWFSKNTSRSFPISMRYVKVIVYLSKGKRVL